MPDLSNLLGAVYGDSASSAPRDPEDEAHVEREPAAEERGPSVPDWADDEHLDAAFDQWKPGPAADASPAERAFVKEVDDDDLPPPLPDDLAAALSEALVASSGAAHDTEVADAEAFGGPKPKPYDFSLLDDDVEPLAEVQPVHQVDEVDEVEPEVEAQVEPVTEMEPVAAVEPMAEVDEVDEIKDEDDALTEVEPVAQADEMDEVDEDDHQEQEEDADDHLRHMPAITSQRAAAAELTAASRPESDAAVVPPTPDPEPAPVASAPVAPIAAVAAAPAASDPANASTATLPAGMRRWDRSDDDILPEKQSKKLFSLSLRRG